MSVPVLAPKDTWFTQGGTTVTRSSITEIEIKDSYTPTGTVTSSWDASAAKDGSVMAYVEGTKLTIAGNGSGVVYANPDSTAAFSSTGSDFFSALTTFNGGNLLNTSKVTNMKDMFRLAKRLKTVDVSEWDTSNVTSMYRMFSGNTNNPMALQSLDVSNWNTGKVTTMAAMFQRCQSLSFLDVSEWNVESVESMQNLFIYCSSLSQLDVKNWNTKSVNNMANMFGECRGLTELDMSNWNVSKVTTMEKMFLNCTNMTSYNFSGWNTASLSVFNTVFATNTALVTIDVSDFDTCLVSNFYQMFEDCSNLKTIIGLDKWNVSKSDTFQDTFAGCSSLTELDLSTWDTSSATKLYRMFANCTKLETIYVSNKWTTSNLKDESYATGEGFNDSIFRNCTNLVGGAGTAYAANHVDYTNVYNDSAYAKIDGGTESPGYLTNNIFLSYTDINVGEKSDAKLTVKSKVHTASDSAVYEIVSGGEFVELVDATTGQIKGTAEGTAKIKVTLTATNGDTITTEGTVKVLRSVPMLAAGNTWFNPSDTSVTRASITQIDIKDSYTPTGTVIAYWDASAAKNGSVMAYVEGTKLTIAGDGSGAVYANPDSSYAFGAKTGSDMFNNLVTFNGASLLNTSKVTTTSNMFRNAIKLKSLDVSNWNTGRVTTFTSMFSGNDHVGDMKIAVLDVTNWDTSSATNMDYMFYGCGQLTEMDLSKWDVSKVTTMNHMFTDCFKMERYDFSGWNTESLKNVNGMFNDNKALVSIDVSDWDTGEIFDFGQIFEGCSNLQTINGLDKWDVSKSQSFLQAFKGCSSLTELNLSSWNTSAVTHAMQMFSGCSNLETIYVSNKWNLSNLKTGTYVLDGEPVGYGGDMFAGCTSLVGGAGTTFNSGIVDKTYAKIDGGTASPGYLTDIDDPSQLLIRTGTLHKLGLSVRHVSGSTSKYTPSEMIDALKTTASNITTQSNLIVQIITALEGKAAGSASIMVSHD